MARRVKKPEEEDQIRDARMFFSKEETQSLKDAYEKAHEEGLTHFDFQGERLNTVYAKYLLSYLGQNGY
ncbi:MAG: hypothetical protein CMH79_05140 [Nitrospinae bacterium]|nr:hypothetical protein [Nitrospinota bacterium]|tara:strand:+ start:360 stop:566 length:207 start_codon:yes stop_codon:yes gene_type:complete